MNISETGLALIRRFEGCKLQAYRDCAGIWTTGYGHTRNVKQGDRITQKQAEALLAEDTRTAGDVVNRLVKIPLTQNQFDALCSFVFNLGETNFARSTLLIRLNEGNLRAAADQFTRWVFAGDKMQTGLYNRRQAERELFLCSAQPR